MESQKTIGIVGGGQLGRMLTLAAKQLGFKVVVLDSKPNSPAKQVGADQILGDLYDPKALKQLAKRADYLTIEIEHLDAEALEALTDINTQINPSPSTIRLIQDKFLQKEHLHKAGIPVAPFKQITDENSATEALNKLGGKILIKTRHGAYDGRGNMIVKSKPDIKKALKLFKDKQLYAEAYVPFEKELAVIIARDVNGKVVTYPTVETIHKRNICVEVIAPAPINENVQDNAEKIAKNVAQLLEGAGIFAIEMFLTNDDKILVNEIAPRVHNSGHHTIEANKTSQFEQHIRAISGLSLGDTSMIVPASVMVNILGERNGETKLAGMDKLQGEDDIHIHIYGKSPTKIDRKMGHINATGPTIEHAKKRAKNARKAISI